MQSPVLQVEVVGGELQDGVEVEAAVGKEAFEGEVFLEGQEIGGVEHGG